MRGSDPDSGFCRRSDPVIFSRRSDPDLGFFFVARIRDPDGASSNKADHRPDWLDGHQCRVPNCSVISSQRLQYLYSALTITRTIFQFMKSKKYFFCIVFQFAWKFYSPIVLFLAQSIKNLNSLAKYYSILTKDWF